MAGDKRLIENFETRPDNRAGDIRPIWPCDETDMWADNANECSINWWAAMGLAICCASAVGVGAGVAWIVGRML